MFGTERKRTFGVQFESSDEFGRIRLALARASYFVGYNVTTAPGEKALESATEFNFAGVLHEEGSGGSHVPCDVEFNDARADDGIMGQCVLTFETLSQRERIEERPLTLEVKIYDTERKYRHIAYDAMRDAAISGNRFMHLEIKTDRVGVGGGSDLRGRTLKTALSAVHRTGARAGICRSRQPAGTPNSSAWSVRFPPGLATR